MSYSMEQTFNRLRRKDFLDVFAMLIVELNAQSLYKLNPILAFEKYLHYAVNFNNRKFIVEATMFPVIESAYWLPEEFIAEGQRRLDLTFNV